MRAFIEAGYTCDGTIWSKKIGTYDVKIDVDGDVKTVTISYAGKSDVKVSKREVEREVFDTIQMYLQERDRAQHVNSTTYTFDKSYKRHPRRGNNKGD